MRTKSNNFVVLFLILNSCLFLAAQENSLVQPYFISSRTDGQHLSLSNDWQLTHTEEPITNTSDLDTKEYLKVKRPTSVQMAYFKAGELPDPYEHLNSEKYLWIEKQVWYYRKSFSPNKDQEEKYAFLTFQGLDYFSKIWLNGKLLGEHRGMFGGPSIEVSEYLDYGEPNELVVEVKSGNYGQWDTFDWRNPGKIVKPRTVARGSSHKPFFAVGMWKGARLDFVPKEHLERPYLVTTKVNEREAFLHLSVEVFTESHSLTRELHLWENEQIGNYGKIEKAPKTQPYGKDLKIELEFWQNNEVAYKETFDVTVVNGRTWLEKDLSLPNPKLWWPNGLGEQNLYTVKTSLFVEGRKVDEIDFEYGIRTAHYKPSPAPRVFDRWKDWQFVVNNEPFFVKGVNWMPADVLLDLPRENYDWLLSAARDAGIQLIRIWGGGILEIDDFYELCAKYGIMVWQDFPKNNNNTPDWPQDVWEAQVVHNIVRLRNQTALAVWCGGNEFNPYTKGNATTMNILERSLDDFDPSRKWLRTSPDFGSTHLYPDFDPTWYKKKLSIIPYVAETGIHSIPEAKSLYEVVDKNEFQNLGGMYDDGFADTHPEFVQHFMEYSPSRVPRMLSRASHIDNMANPSLESISEATQIGAGEFYQIFSEGMQSNYPVTTGLMPWVFKRPWPTVAAIHLLDGFGQPSAPYYFLKRTYEPIHVALQPERLLWKAGEGFPMRLSVINATKLMGTYKVSATILDSSFQSLYNETMDVEVSPGPSVSPYQMESFNIPKDFTSQYFFVLLEMKDGDDKLVSRSVYWPRTIPQMEDSEYYENYTSEPMDWPTLDQGPWLKPIVSKTTTNLALTVLESGKTDGAISSVKIKIENTGKHAAFMTQVNVKGGKRLFRASDNFFWMEPGEEKVLDIHIKWREEAPTRAALTVGAWNAKTKTKRF
ncbi:glycoside hydrolase family 2 protein [Ulvibacterium marinum]|uniref:Beta-mannosidase n=1 Tax=Ulvibacterium marinum TaxID=2419782 RepID=A0A3B0BWS2_9FLAO|nr:sugar-binding domain-containing protein [Ulvibacterium marinum]RKN77011.1 beta-mannosidase [Ulvibacterium marinum]